jgi:hypothetical protein
MILNLLLLREHPELKTKHFGSNAFLEIQNKTVVSGAV